MDRVLRGLSFAYRYVDDMLIASATPEEHLKHLCIVFECLSRYGMVIKPNKCIFGVPELDFLGQCHFPTPGQGSCYPQFSSARLSVTVKPICWPGKFLCRMLPRQCSPCTTSLADRSRSPRSSHGLMQPLSHSMQLKRLWPMLPFCLISSRMLQRFW